ncbi:DUF397 domain-containing protein [Kineosporia babensis]|uniref:DUF397 domain-containing protein n=1 Tax=Kineosporia babensis TaxID=499548 RepID=A0A9X1NM48_9ACTN|nr:DUF397 domain-containing protein [Kineosporia babensis]MCD5316673.1 DUF397 domain-containing protein [Kineosporia babensis]
MTNSELPDLDWHKASISGDQGSCVEFRRHGGMVQIRDSKDPSGPVLTFAPHEIAAMLHGASLGEFDRLAQDAS